MNRVPVTSLESAQYIRDWVNGDHGKPKALLATLSDSYHMIGIDSEREEVTQQVMQFLAAA